MELKTQIEAAKQRYQSLQTVKEGQELTEKRRAIEAAKERFKARLFDAIEPTQVHSLPNFRFGFTERGKDFSGCAFFDLVDEFGLLWSAQITPQLTICLPRLDKEASAKQAQRRREGNYFSWREVKQPDGLTLWETILLTISGWQEEVETLRVKNLISDVRDDLSLILNQDRRNSQILSQRQQAVDNALRTIEEEWILAIAKQQDQEIREIVREQFLPKEEAICFKWQWCSGAYYSDEEEGVVFDYDSKLSTQSELTNNWFETLDGLRLKLNPEIHKPTVEEVVVKLSDYHFKKRRESIRLINAFQIGDLFVYRAGYGAIYPVQLLPIALDSIEPPKEIVLQPRAELSEADFDTVRHFDYADL